MTVSVRLAPAYSTHSLPPLTSSTAMLPGCWTREEHARRRQEGGKEGAEGEKYATDTGTQELRNTGTTAPT